MSLLRACGLAAIGLALFATALRAQVPAPPGAAAPAEAPAPAQPESIPVGEISARAQAVAEDVRALEASLARDEAMAGLRADLEHLNERVGPSAKQVERQLAEKPALGVLSDLRVEWAGLERQIDAREQRLTRLIGSLEQELERLKGERALWKRTQESAQQRGAPEPLLETARTAARDLGRGADAVQKALDEALVLQNRFAELHAAARGVLTSVEDARQGVLDHLLTRDDPPLWQVNVIEEFWQAGDSSVERFLEELRDQVGRYAVQHREALAVHALLFGFLIWALRRAGAALRSGEPRAGAENAEAGALLATQHPLAAAALLALAATPFVHEGLPGQLGAALRLVALAPALVVLRPLLGEALRAPLYLLAVFFVVDRVREILTGSVAPSRVLYSAEMLAVAAMMLALLSPRRLELLPASARGNRWLAALALWIRFSALVALLAALASVTGYTRLARLLGGGVLGSGYAALSAYALLRIGEGLAAALLGGGTLSPVRMLEHHRALILLRTGRVLRALILVGWVLAVAEFFAVRELLFRVLRALLATQLGYGSFEFTLGGVLAFGLTLLGAWLVARAVHFVLDEEVFPRLGLARGVPFALATLARYAILLIGFLVALSALGFDLDRITILLGAFGVGIGFGLQTIVNNFMSGLILLFERPVKVGDWVELAGVEGIVQRIGIRASTVRTFDGADVIVPNGALLSERVVNWTLSDRRRRLTLPVGVAYGSDLQRVMEVLRGVAESQVGVCAYPKPLVAFLGFGESSIDFQVRAWIEDADLLVELRSQLGLAIDAALREAGIEIPFPERTLHLASVTPEAARALRGAAGPERDR